MRCVPSDSRATFSTLVSSDLADDELWPGTRHLVVATLHGAGLPGRGA